MARFNPQKPTPDDALEESRTQDFIHFFTRSPSYDDPSFEDDDQEDGADDDRYTSEDHGWLRSKFRSDAKRPHDDGYIY